MKLTIIIPSFNEAENLESLLSSLKQFVTSKEYEVILVNDASTDDSLTILEQKNKGNWFRLISNKVNRGYGGSIKEGIKVAKGEYVITIDADGQHNIDDIEKLYNYILENNADMIIGSRDDSSSSLIRQIGKSAIRKIVKILMPITIHDINSGMKLYNTKLARTYIKQCPDTMAYSDIITLFFIYKKHLVIETPIGINKRLKGKSTISYKTAINTVFEIINIVMLFNPLKIFLPIAIFSISCGLIWGSQFVLLGKGVSVGALLAIIIGVLLAFLALMSESLSKLRMAMLKDSD